MTLSERITRTRARAIIDAELSGPEDALTPDFIDALERVFLGGPSTIELALESAGRLLAAPRRLAIVAEAEEGLVADCTLFAGLRICEVCKATAR